MGEIRIGVKGFKLTTGLLLICFILSGCYGGHFGTFHSAETLGRNNLSMRVSASTNFSGGGIETIYGITDRVDIGTKWSGGGIGFSGRWHFLSKSLVDMGAEGIIYYDQFGYFSESGAAIISVNKIKYLHPYCSLQWMHFPTAAQVYWEKPTNIQSLSMGIRVPDIFSAEVIVPSYVEGFSEVFWGGALDIHIVSPSLSAKEWRPTKKEPYVLGIVSALFFGATAFAANWFGKTINPEVDFPDWQTIGSATFLGGVLGTMVGLSIERTPDEKKDRSD